MAPLPRGARDWRQAMRLAPVSLELSVPTAMTTHSTRPISVNTNGLDHTDYTGTTYAFANLMSPHDRQLLLESWQRLEPHADQLATVFFDRLFELAPESRRLFSGSTLESQFLRFAYMLVELVALHDEPHKMLLATAQIGQRLSSYGIADAHYLAVSQAIGAMLTHAPEACATPESRAAWHEAYDLLTAIMRRAVARNTRQRVQRAS